MRFEGTLKKYFSYHVLKLQLVKIKYCELFWSKIKMVVNFQTSKQIKLKVINVPWSSSLDQTYTLSYNTSGNLFKYLCLLWDTWYKTQK